MPASMLRLTKGMAIAGRFAIMDEYGQGGTATVYQAMDLMTNQLVAIKHLNLPPTLSPEERELRIQRFQNEAMVMSRLEHPHIMGFHQLHEQDGEYFMALEFLSGTGLDQLAPSLRHQPGKLLDLIDQVADALEYIHQHGLIHLDIKPENILVVNQGQTAKLLDFGIARIKESEALAANQGLVGTISYMSPEQLQNSKLTQAQSDIYSLGVLMYEVFTGYLPYNADNHGAAILLIMNQEPVPPLQLNPLIGEDLNQLILTCMHKQPQHRFMSCQQLRQLIELVRQHNAQSPAFLQSVLPKIRVFKQFALMQVLQTLIENRASGQLLVWTAHQEGYIWLEQGHLMSAQIEHKPLEPVQALCDILCWESGNLMYLPTQLLPQSQPQFEMETSSLWTQAWNYRREYEILWEMYQDEDIPECIMIPHSHDSLNTNSRLLLNSIDGLTSLADLQAQMPLGRLELLESLKILEDRHYIFVERIRK